MKAIQLMASAFVLSVLTTGAVRAQDIPPFIDPELSKLATISIDDAQKVALKKRPGKVVDEKIEKEAGGSGLRWTFFIKLSDGSTREVGVDAKTGKILEDSRAEG